MKPLRLLLWLILLVPAPAILAQESPPVFERASCTFNLPGGFDVECGYVTVPESRNPAIADDTNTLRLAVAVFKSLSSQPLSDPILYLDGGPGGHTLDSLEYFAASFAPFLLNRDVIFFDQRGVGLSGAIDCPEYSDLSYDILDQNLDFAEVIQMSNDTLLTCRQRYLNEGINLPAYVSAENARDAADIVQALGYKQVDLLGISYGTRLGLTIMRDHPEIVRSAILDAVLPLQAEPDTEFLANANRAFTTLFAGCAKDPACNARYPDLETVFYDTVNRLNDSPETVSVFDFYTGKQRKVLVNGDAIISGLFSLLYQTSEIPGLPAAIYSARDGDYDAFIDDLLFTLFRSDTFDEGLFTTIGCNEETPFDHYDSAVASSQGLPEPLTRIFLTQIKGDFGLCAQWDHPILDPADNEPVVSDLPTLLMVGEYDPITPPRWAKEAASTLSRSFVTEFPGVGHATFGQPCATEIIASFLNDPGSGPDSRCLDNIAPPLFATAEIASVNNQPYTDDNLGFTAIVPENWFEVEPGVFTPYPAMEQPIPVIAYRFPASIDDYISRIITTGFYAYDSLPEPTDQLQINGRVWTLYQIERTDQDVYTSFAFTETDVPYVIGVTATTPEERDYLYDALLIPAVKAFKIGN